MRSSSRMSIFFKVKVNWYYWYYIDRNIALWSSNVIYLYPFDFDRMIAYLRMCYSMSLCPESSENIPILFQASDLCFLNQNYIRNPKMGSKQSIVFGAIKSCFVDFCIFMAIYMDKLDQFKKNITEEGL